MIAIISCDASPMNGAIGSLKNIAKRSPHLVQSFLDGLNSTAQLCRVDDDIFPATGTDKYRVVLQPSDLLADFLAAAGAGD